MALGSKLLISGVNLFDYINSKQWISISSLLNHWSLWQPMQFYNLQELCLWKLMGGEIKGGKVWWAVWTCVCAITSRWSIIHIFTFIHRPVLISIALGIITRAWFIISCSFTTFFLKKFCHFIFNHKWYRSRKRWRLVEASMSTHLHKQTCCWITRDSKGKPLSAGDFQRAGLFNAISVC